MKANAVTLTHRLWIMTGLLLTSLLTVGVFSGWNADRLARQGDEVVGTDLPAVRSIGTVRILALRIRFDVLAALAASAGASPSNAAELERDFLDAAKNVGKEYIELGKLDLGDEGKAQFARVKPDVDKFADATADAWDAASSKDRAFQVKKMGEFNAVSTSLDAGLHGLADLIEKRSQQSLQNTRDVEVSAKTTSVLLVLLGFISGTGVAFWVIRDVTKTMGGISSSLGNEATHLAASAQKIDAESNHLSTMAVEQSAAITETAAAMEEMTSMMGQTAQNSDRTLDETRNGQSEALKGKAVILKLSRAMNDIQGANDRLKKLVKLIEDIKSRTKVINDIASETRLLSFNASIEAARAGAHGRGFAVVAEEVGKLATVSSKAADEIRQTLENSVTEASEIVGETSARVKQGQDVSTECETAFGTMEAVLTRIVESVKHIASATREQEVGIRQVNTALGEMDRVTIRNTKSGEELATQARLLSTAAGTLTGSVGRMQSYVFGAAPGAVNAKTAPTGGAAGADAASPTEAQTPSTSGSDRAAAVGPEAAAVKPAEPGGQAGVPAVGRNDSRWRAA